ncbi:MAG: peptidoglycan-binding protein [Alicyclobacillus sp.]|nr:peptidoglycan-binding protein [Alicyclobacillus sp.]
MNRKVLAAVCLSAATFTGFPAVFGALPSATAATAATLPMLRLGDAGTAVQTLQQDLNAAGFSAGTPDGIFGPGTETAVKKFQTAHQLTADGIVGTATWTALLAAMGPTPTDYHTSSITLNGKLISAPQSFVWQNTTYMPIYYVQQLLKQFNILYGWDGTHWTMQVPSTYNVDLSQMPIDQQHSGDMDISINGHVFAYMKGLVEKDPASGHDTTYMPIWYVIKMLDRLQIPSNWDGKNWTFTKAVVYQIYDKTGKRLNPTVTYNSVADAQAALANTPGGTVRDSMGNTVFTEPDYTAYQKGGKAVIGDFTTLPAAEAAVANIPGAVVKDASGQVQYTAPDFEVFTSPVTAPKDFSTLAQALAAIQNNNTAYVVDALKNQVVQPPANFYYVDNTGAWRNSLTGYVGTAPGFAQVGDKYIQVASASGQSPQIYLISTADGTYMGTLQGSYSNPFQTVDLRQPAPATVTAAQIDSWFQSNNSPLAGLGQAYITAQNTYGVNATYLVAHSVEETGWGKSAIALAKNNLFGYGAYDSNPAHDAGMFPSNEYAIRYEAWVVRANYLEPSGPYYDGPTLNGMNVHYATDPGWATAIAKLMSQYVAQTGGSPSDYKQFSIGMTGPIPEVAQEPVYAVNGAEGSVQSNPYGNLPVYPDSVTGSTQMYPGVLQEGNSGAGVRDLQEALLNASLQPDGVFGPLTLQAVKDWQQSHGLPVTGVVDFATWTSLYPAPSTSLPVGTTVTIDQMKQGMVGNLVTLWYHVTGSNGVSGWVDADYISPQVTVSGQTSTNLFRVTAASGSNVPVYASESTGSPQLGSYHNGDEVVTPQLYPVTTPVSPDAQGFIAVNWVNQTTGQAQTGYITAAQLTPLTPPVPMVSAGN